MYQHSEAQLETLFRMRVMNTLGGRVFKMSPITKGMPDRLVLLPLGRIRLVELKTVTGRRSPKQIHWHEQAAGLGTHVYTLHGLPEIDAWIQRMAREYDNLITYI